MSNEPLAIPFNRASLTGDEMQLMADALRGGHISGDGPFTRRCHALLEEALGAPRVLMTTSCTHALEMSALLLQVGPGDEVILPAFTFVSTVNAFILRGATPVFADVSPLTLNINPAHVARLISARTAAIVVVHYAGVGCEMTRIREVAGAIPIVEDNAHGLFGTRDGRPLGSFGALATLSFHETKNFTCGEGGALVVNDPALIERAEVIREKGTNRSRFFRGQVDKYSWVDVGSSYLPSDMLAAFLCAQLQAREAVQARRHAIWQRYATELAPWAERSGVALPHVPAECGHSAHLFYLLLPDLERRQALIAHLRGQGIMAVFHYLPLHLSEMGRKFGGAPGQCPVTERVSDQLLRLPLYFSLTEQEQTRVIEAVVAFSCAG